jgi:hypothetical protein
MNTPTETAEQMVEKYGKDMSLRHCASYALNHRCDAVDRKEKIPNLGELYWNNVKNIIMEKS